MQKNKLNIKFTAHAGEKAEERKISPDLVRNIVTDPMVIENDKFDKTFSHYIKKIDNRYLRVIGRWKNEETFIVISAFFDRRLIRRFKNDKN
jgi:hypothetical protein